jgi:hypothetical protein
VLRIRTASNFYEVSTLVAGGVDIRVTCSAYMGLVLALPPIPQIPAHRSDIEKSLIFSASSPDVKTSL